MTNKFKPLAVVEATEENIKDLMKQSRLSAAMFFIIFMFMATAEVAQIIKESK